MGPPVEGGGPPQSQDIVFVSERPSNPSPFPRGLTGNCGLAPRPSDRLTRSTSPDRNGIAGGTFGNGTMSDLGSHWNDLPFWALKLQSTPDHRGGRSTAPS